MTLHDETVIEIALGLGYEFGSGKFDPDPHWDNSLEMKETISGWADEFEQATKGRDWNAENGDYILAIEAFIAMKLAELVYRFEAGR